LDLYFVRCLLDFYIKYGIYEISEKFDDKDGRTPDLFPSASVVEPDPESEPQEPQLFALAEPELECIPGSGSGTGFGSNATEN
jgi:hypothetical protein